MNRKKLISSFIGLTVALVILCVSALTASAKTEDGLKYLSVGDYKKAEASFKGILKDDADNKEASYYLGLTCLLQEDFKESLDIFKNLLKTSGKKSAVKSNEIPTKGQVVIGLVRSYLGLKKYEDAHESLIVAEEVEADPVEILTYKGALYLEKNEDRKAYDTLKKAVKLNSKNPYTYYYAGVANIRMGKPKDAVKLFEHFLDMAPYVPEAKNARILVDTLC